MLACHDQGQVVHLLRSSTDTMIFLIRKEQKAPDLTASKDQSQCRLLSLPAELRSQIWECLLVQDTHAAAQMSSTAPDGVKRRAKFCANILRTCKQIHTEGTPILYGQNVFLAHPSLLTSLPSFLLVVRPSRLKLPPVTCPRVAKFIRRFFIQYATSTEESALMFKKPC